MHNPLQDLDKLQASTSTKQNTLRYVMSKQKKKPFVLRYATLCATVCLLFVLIFLPSNNNAPITTNYAAVVTLDINPSLELKLDENMQVIDVNAYNNDAKRILKQVSLQDKNVEEALSILLKEQDYATYLQDGVLEVGVYADDESTTSSLETMISTYLESELEQANYHCARIDEATYTNAQEHHTSAGKYRVIEQIQQYDASLTFEDLEKESMKDLYSILGEFDATAVPENCQSQNSEHGKQNKGNGNGHHGRSH